MPRSRKGKPIEAEPEAPRLLSHPLETLVFLLPLLLAYEIGCLLLHRSAGGITQDRVVAFHLLHVFIQNFGYAGMWMPGLAVVVILLCTQIASRQPWQVRRRAVGLMYVEAAMMAVPLVALNHVLHITPLSTGVAVSTGNAGDLATEAVLGIGAAVYEELVFRLVLISAIVMLGADFLHLPQRVVLIVAVIVSALAFSAHHHPPLGSEPFEASAFFFRTCAGLYLGALFVWRGYGPAAGTHAAYNLLVAMLA